MPRTGATPRARLLASTAGGRRASLLLTAALVELALAAEYPLLRFTSQGVRQIQLRAHRCLALGGLRLKLLIDAWISVFAPMRTRKGPAVQGLAKVGLHDKLAMGLLGQLHVLAGKRLCVGRCSPSACIKPETSKFYATHGSENGESV